MAYQATRLTESDRALQLPALAGASVANLWMDGTSSMRKITPDSARLQRTLACLPFFFTALFLLFYPLGRPLETLRNGFHLRFVMNLSAWTLLSVVGLVWLWQIANSRNKDLSLVFTRYVLFLFVLFFSIERFAASLIQEHPHRLEWIQLLSSAVVGVAAAAILPRLRGVKDSAALAQKEHDRFLAAMESSLDDFYIFDGLPDASGQIVDFRFSYINPNAERRLQVSRESLIGRVLTEVRPFMITSGLIEQYREVVRTGVPFTCEVFLDDEMIRSTWLNVQVVRLGNGIAITSRDVTERRRLADHVQYLAHYDQLTGLANRTLLQDRLYQAILQAQRYHHRVALFVLDVDHFKQINDSLGHADGDALLIAIGERLASKVCETDTVARIGGDEFVVVLPDFKSIEEIRQRGLEMIQNAAKPIFLGDRELRVTVSVGACIFPDHAEGEKELFKNADAAMYLVKDAGRNGFHLFSEDLVKKEEIRMEPEHDRSPLQASAAGTPSGFEDSRSDLPSKK
jgi:diguanylate cyclase (GGDEF)-like protein